MEKSFEITYSPANWTAPPSGQAVQWTTPYGGLNVQTPENLIGPSYTPLVNNFFFRNAELRTRPAFKQILPGPDGTNIILAVGSFLSNAQVWHTFAITPRGLFQLVPNSTNQLIAGQSPWVFLGGPTLVTAPAQWWSFAGILYYSNGIHLSAWDGQALNPINDVAFLGPTANPTVITLTQVAVSTGVATYSYSSYIGTGPMVGLQVTISGFSTGGNNVTATITGGSFGSSGTFTVNATTQANETHAGEAISDPTLIGGIFIAELANHLIIANVTESTSSGSSSVNYPNRIRWSNTGFNPNLNGTFGANLGTIGATFDPNITLTAGLNDLLDVPDLITGLMTVGQMGYIFRQNGITEFSPTGNGLAPFDFNHLWASQNGIGNVYPFTIAQYGNIGIFVAYDNVYMVQGQTVAAIGGGARDAIVSDLANATGSPKASIDRGFSLGYTYLVYHLRIPLANSMRSYVFSMEDNNWTVWTETGVWPTGISNECWV